MFGLYRQRVSTDDTAFEKLPIDCALPGTGWVIFCQASLPGWRYWQAGPAAQSQFFHFYQRGISVFTSAFCARCRTGDPLKRSPASLQRSAPRGSNTRIVTAFGDHLNFFAKAVIVRPGTVMLEVGFSAIWAMIAARC